jgi:large subunit ribosomal protein L11
MEQARKIAQDKLEDLNTTDVEMGARVVAGTARSMGIEVTGS